MATDVTTRPQYLNANNLVYSFWDLRRYMDADPPGPGVNDYESFRVQPRQAGVNLSVDVGKTAVGLMQAWVRGSTRDGQGLYRVDNIDVTAPSANNFLAQLNVAVTSNASGNPRLDQVVLVIADSQHAGGVNKAYLDVIAGTPTAAASLDNRTGAAALPASCILLADILLASGDVTVDPVDIRDRRPFCLRGVVPPVPLAAGAVIVDMVTFEPSGGLVLGAQGLTPGGHDNTQGAVLCYLPRGIKQATRIRWHYQHGATPAGQNVTVGIYDASGRLKVASTPAAMGGGANTSQNSATTIAATDFEPGYYYCFFGTAAVTAASGSRLIGYIGSNGAGAGIANCGAPVPNVQLRSATGGTTAPATLLAFTDVSAQTALTDSVPIPLMALSVG